MKRICKQVIAVALTLTAVSAHARQVQGTVSQLAQRASDGLIYVVINGTATGTRPTCATSIYWMITNENSDAGKKQFALLLAAQARGAQVVITGMNTCNRWGDGEDINEVTVLE